jgi:phosphoribosylanthranilate isomerase
MRVKICGITNPEDALVAAACGADAVGAVNISESRRYVSLPQIEKIFSVVPPFVTRVVVASPENLEDVLKIEETGADFVQLHGDCSPELLEEIRKNTRLRTIKTVAAEPGCEIEAKKYSQVADAILLDTKAAGILGGTGKMHDLGLSRRIVESVQGPVILAGGLTAENISYAIASVRPYAVDVSSGVEMSPGKKDKKKITEFIMRAKQK